MCVRVTLGSLTRWSLVLAGCLIAGCGGEHARGPVRVRVVGPERDISRARGLQAEVAVASGSRTLLASSHSAGCRMRVYASRDRGRSWSSSIAPPPPPGLRGACEFGDPAVAVDGQGEGYIGVMVGAPCRPHGSCLLQSSRLYVAHQERGVWVTPSRPVAPAPSGVGDDKDAIAIDEARRSPHRGRLYATWTRYSLSPSTLTGVLISHSDDGARSWSPAHRVPGPPARGLAFATVATGTSGDVYVAWLDADHQRIGLVRSTDGGQRFGRAVAVTGLRGPLSPGCRLQKTRIPAEPRRCVRAIAHLVTDPAGRVHVVYEDGDRHGVQDVFASTFDPLLRPVVRRTRVNPADRRVRSDQFLPAAAVDPSTGWLWVCFYDTSGDPARRRATYSCTASGDGGRSFATPVRAASQPSDETAPPASPFEYGEYAGVTADRGRAYPVWTDARRLRTLREEIYANVLAGAAR